MDDEKLRIMLNSQTESIKSFFSVLIDDLKSDIREIRNENLELRRSLEFNSAEINDLKDKLHTSTLKVQE